MSAQKVIFVSAVAVMVLASSISFAADIQGSKDHPLITRFSGSEIIAYEAKAFDEYRLVLGPPARDANLIRCHSDLIFYSGPPRARCK